MSPGSVVIGLGNAYRRDDGIGPAVAAAVEALRLPGVQVRRCAVETTAILDAWDGARLAVLVDAAAGDQPGRVRQCSIEEFVEPARLSSHELGLKQTYELALALGRAPESVAVVTVDIADIDYGVGLSPAVSAALPEAVVAVHRFLAEHAEEAAYQQP